MGERAPNPSPWLETRGRKKFDILNPTADMVSIFDIASHLSKACRYVGACPNFYSVAEHSMIGAMLIPEPDKLAFLLHDAHEAYLGDLTRPFQAAVYRLLRDEGGTKSDFDPIKELKNRIDLLISDKYDVNLAQRIQFFHTMSYNRVVKDFDNAMLRVEAESFGFHVEDWELPPTNAKIDKKQFEEILDREGFALPVVNHGRIADQFVNMFYGLGGKE